MYIPDVKFNDVTKYTYFNRNLIQTTREVAIVDLLDFFSQVSLSLGTFGTDFRILTPSMLPKRSSNVGWTTER